MCDAYDHTNYVRPRLHFWECVDFVTSVFKGELQEKVLSFKCVILKQDLITEVVQIE